MNDSINQELLRVFDDYKQLEQSLLVKYYNNEEPLPDFVLWNYNQLSGVVDFFINHNISRAKNNFSACGMLDIYCTYIHNSHFLDNGFKHVCFAVLSDNESMIQRYAKLRYRAYGKRLSMDEYVLKGEGAILCNTIQFFIENNNEGVERNLNIYEIKKEKVLQGAKMLELDFAFFKALYASDKSKIEEILNKLVTPRVHKKRTDSIILDKFISLPALGYAKLAWRKGIEVEVNSPLIPKELLPIEPLEHYEIPYEFLK